jgi:hypothetical protein
MENTATKHSRTTTRIQTLHQEVIHLYSNIFSNEGKCYHCRVTELEKYAKHKWNEITSSINEYDIGVVLFCMDTSHVKY